MRELTREQLKADFAYTTRHVALVTNLVQKYESDYVPSFLVYQTAVFKLSLIKTDADNWPESAKAVEDAFTHFLNDLGKINHLKRYQLEIKRQEMPPLGQHNTISNNSNTSICDSPRPSKSIGLNEKFNDEVHYHDTFHTMTNPSNTPVEFHTSHLHIVNILLDIISFEENNFPEPKRKSFKVLNYPGKEIKDKFSEYKISVNDLKLLYDSHIKPEKNKIQAQENLVTKRLDALTLELKKTVDAKNTPKEMEDVKRVAKYMLDFIHANPPSDGVKITVHQKPQIINGH